MKSKEKRAACRPKGQSEELTPEEVELFLKLPDRKTKVGKRDYAVLLTLANTPMRRRELVSLTVGDLVDHGSVKLVTYKGLKKRKKAGVLKQKPYWLKIPVTAVVFEAIQNYVRTAHRGKPNHAAPLFMTLGIHGPWPRRGITIDVVDNIVERYAEKFEKVTGVRKRITPHSFRATYLTMRAPGRDPATLLGLSGHSDIRGLMPYIRSSEKKRQEAALAFSFA